MIGLGTTLRCNLPPRHLYVVLSDPAQTGGPILLVNLTALDDDCVDDASILGAEDYPRFLTHATPVAYSRAQAGTVARLQALVEGGHFRLIAPIPPPTPAKMLKGAHQSRELSDSQKQLVAISSNRS
jgi:hypothetical protein